MPDRIGIGSLTDRERECLRLVLPGFSEKGLAKQLGNISPYTVKNHLKAARAKLGVSSSVTAAAMLAESEGRPFPGTSTTNAIFSESAPDYPPLDDRGRTSMPDFVGEAPSRPFVGFDRPDVGQSVEERRNDLTPLVRLAVIAGIVLVLILAVAAAPALYDSFQRAANSIEPPTK